MRYISSLAIEIDRYHVARHGQTKTGGLKSYLYNEGTYTNADKLERAMQSAALQQEWSKSD